MPGKYLFIVNQELMGRNAALFLYHLHSGTGI